MRLSVSLKTSSWEIINMKNVFFFSLVIIAFCMCWGERCAYAENAYADEYPNGSKKRTLDDIKTYYDSHVYNLDGTRYTRDQIIIDFTHAAYPRYIWKQNNLFISSNNGWFLNSFKTHPSEQKRLILEKYPSRFSSYVFRPQGRPKFSSLNRWNRDMKLGLDLSGLDSSEQKDKIFNTIGPHIQDISNKLSSSIGRSINFVGSAKGCLSGIDICISFTDSFSNNNRFKSFGTKHGIENTLSGASLKSADISYHKIEAFLSDAVEFTPASRGQVRGYFIPDHQNNIDFSACQIWPYMDDDLMKSLVTECMVRSLGLPDLSVHSSYSILSNWNIRHDNSPYSGHVDSESEDALVKRLIEKPSKETLEEIQSEIESNRSKTIFVHKDPDIKVPTSISDYDVMMLRLLYCEDISPGVDVYQTISILYNSDRCFKK